MTVGATTTRLTPAQFADVVQGLEFNRPLSGRQATIAAAVVDSRIIDRPMRLRNLVVNIGTTGSAGATSVDIKKNGATVLNAVLTVDNTAADGTQSESVDFIDDAARDCAKGDVVIVEVTAAPTAGADLDWTVNADARFDPLTERDILGP